MLFGVLAGGVFDHIHCEHTGEFDKKEIKMSWKYSEGDGQFWNWLVQNITHFTSLMKFVWFERKKKIVSRLFSPEFWKYLLNIFSYLTVFKQGKFIM